MLRCVAKHRCDVESPAILGHLANVQRVLDSALPRTDIFADLSRKKLKGDFWGIDTRGGR